MKTLSALLFAATMTLTACGGEPDITTETCERLDECNVLSTSVNDCIEEFDLLLRDLTPTEQRDFERLMDDCLEFEGCATFLSCAGFSGGGSSNDPSDPGDPDTGEGPGSPAP